MRRLHMHRLLVIDDEAQMRSALSEVLRRKGYEVVIAENGEDGITRLSKERFDAVITDVKMPGISGLEVLRSAKRLCPALPVLIMTAFGTIENAIEAMKEGARDYLLKPFSPELIDSAVRKLITSEAGVKDFGIVAISSSMKRIMDIAKDIAHTQVSVLITGESGTGKELLARFIHINSSRRDKPFIAINCASIPEGLLESELFGHEKGAFTGAISNRKGKFEAAHGGTLLLDEIGEMGLSLQAKLLRVLQEREVDKIGGSGAVPVDIRVIATTNRDLKKEVEAKRFREDLFYRLNVFPIVIPPLRERREDISLLAGHFLKVFCSYNGKEIQGITADVMTELEHYPWRGNVRELQNVMERAVIMCRGAEIQRQDLWIGDKGDADLPVGCFAHTNGSLQDMEREMIYRMLSETNGNKTRAAKLLGISVRTIRNKLKEYGEKVAQA